MIEVNIEIMDFQDDIKNLFDRELDDKMIKSLKDDIEEGFDLTFRNNFNRFRVTNNIREQIDK